MTGTGWSIGLPGTAGDAAGREALLHEVWDVVAARVAELTGRAEPVAGTCFATPRALSYTFGETDPLRHWSLLAALDRWAGIVALAGKREISVVPPILVKTAVAIFDGEFSRVLFDQGPAVTEDLLAGPCTCALCQRLRIEGKARKAA